MKSNYHLIIIIFLLISCKNNNTLRSRNVYSETIENLYFSKINIEKNTLNDYSKSFTLNKDEYLNLHFTLEKPLVKSIQDLAPHLKENELLEKGNFQFSFFVDNKLIYVENLHKGAGLPETKTKELSHTVRLIAPKKLDYWGWFMWLKFMNLGGGQDLLIDKHSLSIEIRPYIKEESLKVGPILAKGKINIDVAEIPVDESLITVQKIEPNSGWELSKDIFDKKKIETLNRKIAEGRFENINGIVVIKNNKLLIEEYFNGENRNSLHDPKSVGKSFASTILGIAIEDGYIESENVLLKDFYSLKKYNNYNQKKDSVTLKSLLTMSSNFVGDDNDYNSVGNEEKMYPTDNWVKFTLDLPIQNNKKNYEKFEYFTAGVVVLGDIIHKSVPNGLVEYAEKKLFKPLGITNYKWEYTPQNIGNTAGGIRLRALDFAKYGQLYKNKGEWNGKQLLSRSWVNKSLDKQIEQSQGNGHYGYLFWNKDFSVDDKKYNVSYCSGNGGNKVYIFKDLPYVIVITSSLYNHPNAHANSEKIVTDYILPAIIE